MGKHHHCQTRLRKAVRTAHKNGDSVPGLLNDTDLNMGLDQPVGGHATLEPSTQYQATGSMSLLQATVQTQVLFQIWIADLDGNVIDFIEPDVTVNNGDQTWTAAFITPAASGDYTYNIQATYCPNDSFGIEIEENTGLFTVTA